MLKVLVTSIAIAVVLFVALTQLNASVPMSVYVPIGTAVLWYVSNLVRLRAQRSPRR